ncbi:sugar ABC transporter permease [Kribbella sp. NPDC050820]|uniref:carbohydrate ABC transporter permease n=1 Tax=Kribbella sp. NPDC050820 TaxID=3155408 RepID=UPI0033D0C3AD
MQWSGHSVGRRRADHRAVQQALDRHPGREAPVKRDITLLQAEPGRAEDGQATSHVELEAAPRPNEQRQRRTLSCKHRRLAANIAFAAPAIAFLATFALYPLYVLLRLSLSDVKITNILGYWPAVGLRNFQEILNDQQFRSAVNQTFIFVAGVVAFTMTISFATAMLLRAASHANHITQATMILVSILPPVVIGSLWKFLLASDSAISRLFQLLHLADHPVAFLAQPGTALICVGVATVWASVPFTTMVLKSAILDVPVDLQEAASMDGAGRMRVLWHVILPLLRPTLLIMTVLNIVAAFKAFDYIYVMTQGGPGTSSSTIPFLGYLTAFTFFNFGQAAAMSVIAMMFVALIAALYIRTVRTEERS